MMYFSHNRAAVVLANLSNVPGEGSRQLPSSYKKDSMSSGISALKSSSFMLQARRLDRRGLMGRAVGRANRAS
jgi:hypothetical protein